MAASTGTTDKPQDDPKAKNAGVLTEEQRPPGDLRRRVGTSRRKGPFVKYVGPAAIRRITSAQWKSLGIDLKGDAVETNWDVSNDKLVEASKFSDAQLDYLLIDDLQQGSGTHAFLLVDFDENGQLVQVAY